MNKNISGTYIIIVAVIVKQIISKFKKTISIHISLALQLFNINDLRVSHVKRRPKTFPRHISELIYKGKHLQYTIQNNLKDGRYIYHYVLL